MTALFYCAVHELEAALIALGEPVPKNHEQRKKAMRQNFKAVAPKSVAARYECKRHAQTSLPLPSHR